MLFPLFLKIFCMNSIYKQWWYGVFSSQSEKEVRTDSERHIWGLNVGIFLSLDMKPCYFFSHVREIVIQQVNTVDILH